MACSWRVVSVILAFILLCTGLDFAQATDLDVLKEQVARQYPAVSRLTPSALAELLQGDRKPIIFDVREKEEFAVSHIPNAIQVDPSMSSDLFLKRFSAGSIGRIAVFYCAVGVRSSKLIDRLRTPLSGKLPAVYNLDGGIFAWHNAGQILENDKGVTQFVHPYDAYWGRLILRPDLTRRRLD